MNSKYGIVAMGLSGGALLIVALFVAIYPGETIGGSSEGNAAGILALTTGAAIAIERAIESLWTIIGMTKSTRWPLKPIGDRLDGLLNQLNKDLDTVFESASSSLKELQDEGEIGTKALEAANEDLSGLQGKIAELKRLDPGNQDAQRVAAEISGLISKLKKPIPNLTGTANKVNRTLDSVSTFVQTFEDNPARRLISIYIGAIIGLLVAYTLGLDAIQATLGQKTFGICLSDNCSSDEAFYLFANLGVAATGLVMGLGSVPTHEVIKALQESKKSNKRSNKAKS